VDSGGTLLALLNFKRYTLIFIQNLKTITLNGAVMNKYITTFIVFDEAEAFAFVKPLYGTFMHFGNPPFLIFLKLDRLHIRITLNPESSAG
jgi:hypothetical protein